MTQVYRSYTQAALDAQYDNQAVVPGFRTILQDYARATDAAISALSPIQDIAYGSEPRHRIDLYATGGEPKPVVLFLHGGQWQQLSRADSGFAAPALAAAGAMLAVPDFGLIPAVTLVEMVADVRLALGWLRRNCAEFGGDPQRIFVAGHSSGAHLAGMLLAGGWRAQAGLPPDLIAGAHLGSGIYDMEPVRRSFRNGYLKLAAEEARRLGLIHTLPRRRCPIAVSVADGETDEFKRQAQALARAWGPQADLIEIPGRNHFDAALDLGRPGSQVFSALTRMIAISALPGPG